MLFKIYIFRNFIIQLKSTTMRFPLSVVTAVVASILTLYLIYDIDISNRFNTKKLLLTFFYLAIAFTSLKLIVENHAWSIRVYLTSVVGLIFVMILFIWGITTIVSTSSHWFFSLSIISSILFVPYISKKSTSESYWYFNYKTGVAFFFATVAAAILGSGISLILLSISFLFEIEIINQFYSFTWVLGSGFLFLFYFLSNISKEYDFDQSSCDFPKGISFITNYILVPLMWAYMALLYAYFFKILIQWQLPRGNLGWFITTFGIIGIVTKLLMYPIRKNGTKLLQLFDNYYYYVLIIPTILLAVAIGVRIQDYGITESRYTVVLIAIWFSIVTILTIVKKDKFHIKYVIIIFSILTLLASFGPWGVDTVSLNSQLNRFKIELIKHGLLVNGQIIKTEKQLSYHDQQTLSSMIDYLAHNNTRRKTIIPWFRTLIISDKSNSNTKENRYYNASHLIKLIGIEYFGNWRNSQDIKNFNYLNTKLGINKKFIDVSEFDHISNIDVYLNKNNRNYNEFKINYKNDIKTITINYTNQYILINLANNEQVKFNIKQVANNLNQKNIKTINSNNQHLLTLEQTSKNKNILIRLQIEKLSGSFIAKKYIEIRQLNYLFMIKINN